MVEIQKAHRTWFDRMRARVVTLKEAGKRERNERKRAQVLRAAELVDTTLRKAEREALYPVKGTTPLNRRKAGAAKATRTRAARRKIRAMVERLQAIAQVQDKERRIVQRLLRKHAQAKMRRALKLVPGQILTEREMVAQMEVIDHQKRRKAIAAVRPLDREAIACALWQLPLGELRQITKDVREELKRRQVMEAHTCAVGQQVAFIRKVKHVLGDGTKVTERLPEQGWIVERKGSRVVVDAVSGRYVVNPLECQRLSRVGRTPKEEAS